MRVSVARVSGDAPPQPLAARVRTRLANRRQTVRRRTTAEGGEQGSPCGPARTMRSRLNTPEFVAALARLRAAPGADPATEANQPGSSGSPEVFGCPPTSNLARESSRSQRYRANEAL